MKAILYLRYGSPDVLELQDTEKPAPADDEVLLRVSACSVNPYDWHFMRGEPYPLRLMAGLRKPKLPRLGADLAGTVEAVGRNVSQFGPGDRVFGTAKGAFAEYVCARASGLAKVPDNVSFEQAASAPIAALTALQALRDKGHIHAGQKVLVNGAAGGVGTFAVQIAKSFGAEVTGVCSTRNLEMVRSIGADHVIDYTREDFTKSESHYHILLDLVGNHPLMACGRVLHANGIYVGAGGTTDRWMVGLLVGMVALPLLSLFGSRKFTGILAHLNSDDLTVIAQLIAQGEIRPIIDRRYSLSEVTEAIRYVEQGHARGKVVISVG